jgi:hypothetical protein
VNRWFDKPRHFLKVIALALMWLVQLPMKMSKHKNQTAPSSSPGVLQEFCKANAHAWKNNELPGYSGGKRVLVEGLNPHKAYLMVNLVIGGYLMRMHHLAGAGLLHAPDPEVEAMFRAYGITEFYYLSDLERSLGARLRSGFRAFRVMAAHSRIDDLLEYKRNGVFIGKAVYDWYLRAHGVGTVDEYSLLFFSMLATSLLYDERIAGLFAGEGFPVIVQAERQFVPEGILFQNAIASGLDVYSRGGGPTSFTIRRFTHPEQIFMNTHRYGQTLFDYVWNNYRAQAEEAGTSFMADRFSGNIRKNDIADAIVAHSGHENMDRETLCEMFDWDPEKPIVIIMSNMLSDGVFTNRWSLFRDLLSWLDETVRAAVANDSVNWLVKAHPSDKNKNVKISGRESYENHASDHPHVRFYPNEWGNKSLLKIVSTVLTAHGSAGIEFSTFGIPCVLGGESLYSGLGFSHEPQTRAEYFTALANIQELKPLSQEQMARAKVFTYIYLLLSRVESSILPDVSKYADYDDDKYLQDAIDLLRRHDPLEEKLGEMMRIQVEGGYRHMLNYDWVGLEAECVSRQNEQDRLCL